MAVILAEGLPRGVCIFLKRFLVQIYNYLTVEARREAVLQRLAVKHVNRSGTHVNPESQNSCSSSSFFVFSLSADQVCNGRDPHDDCPDSNSYF